MFSWNTGEAPKTGGKTERAWNAKRASADLPRPLCFLCRFLLHLQLAASGYSCNLLQSQPFWPLILCRQFLATTITTGSDDLAAANCRHAGTETVAALANELRGLIGALHGTDLNIVESGTDRTQYFGGVITG